MKSSISSNPSTLDSNGISSRRRSSPKCSLPPSVLEIPLTEDAERQFIVQQNRSILRRNIAVFIGTEEEDAVSFATLPTLTDESLQEDFSSLNNNPSLSSRSPSSDISLSPYELEEAALNIEETYVVGQLPHYNISNSSSMMILRRNNTSLLYSEDGEDVSFATLPTLTAQSVSSLQEDFETCLLLSEDEERDAPQEENWKMSAPTVIKGRTKEETCESYCQIILPENTDTLDGFFIAELGLESTIAVFIDDGEEEDDDESSCSSGFCPDDSLLVHKANNVIEKETAVVQKM